MPRSRLWFGSFLNDPLPIGMTKMIERQVVVVVVVVVVVDLSIRSWLCSTQVDSSSKVNLQLIVNHLQIRLINQILGGIKVSNSFIIKI